MSGDESSPEGWASWSVGATRHWRRSVVTAGVVFVALVLLVAGRLFYTGEPSYEGRSLSAWLEDLDGQAWNEPTAAAEAIRAMGTNVIPYLVEDIVRQDSTWRQAARRQFRQPMFRWFHRNPAGLARSRASKALRALGSNAAPALPLLIDHAKDERGITGLAWDGLAVIYPAVPETFSTLTNQLAGPEHRAALTRFVAYNVTDPELAVPYFVAGLQDADPNVLVFCLVGLSRQGREAAPAESAVRVLLEHPEPRVAQLAEQVMRKIEAAGD